MVGFVFPGQGSQSLGMLSAYSGVSPVAEAVVEASAALDVDLAEIIENNETALNETRNTQPALLAVGVGVYRAVCDKLPTPTFLAGHSLGEYAALVCAGALSLTEAAALVVRRAEHMRRAVKDGGMAAALGLPSATVEKVCAALRDEGEQVWAANYNSDNQTVIAGLNPSLRRAEAALKSAGARRVVWLPMSVPSHCPLLQPAADAFAADLRKVNWRKPALPVLHNAAVAAGGDSDTADFLRRTLAAQLVQPVRWTDILRQFADGGVERVVESGPGKALTNLGKKSGIAHVALDSAVAIRMLVG